MLKGNKNRKLIIVSLISATLTLFPYFGSAQNYNETSGQDEHVNDSHSAGNHTSDFEDSHVEKEFNAGEFILDHVKDSHEWHLWTKADGSHVSVPLPIILLSKEQGLVAFFSSKLAHGHHYNGFFIEEGKIYEETTNHESIAPLDFSITKNVAGMMIASLLILILFIRMGSIYRKKTHTVPSGLNGFLEPMILFIRDDIAIPNIGEDKYEKFMPYLLTVFFFILMNNLMGLVPAVIPFGANVTGNIAVTLVLSTITFIITQLNGTKTYWKHIVATPGVPFWLAPVMIPVEIIGLFSKPFALMIRLFANITAGHIIILSLVSLIFIFKSFAIAPVSIAFVLFMDCIEILVAFLQAYVFTLLSALFIGLAAKEHHH
ncbi:MAG: F0F1 ATP synthase subunit A [Bacteroidales bacterium]|nr:F0F1 ATP synthase subunit A [Bacteroidales bacterium]